MANPFIPFIMVPVLASAAHLDLPPPTTDPIGSDTRRRRSDRRNLDRHRPTPLT
jgi:hypothetical protein